MTKLRIQLWRGALVCLVLASSYLAWSSYGGKRQEYNLQESIEKLDRIGRALRAYRQAHPAKPVGERKTAEDAGLPATLELELLVAGQPWSLPLSTFRISAPWPSIRNQGGHFVQLYWPADMRRATETAWAFSARGESLPVLADYNINTLGEFSDPDSPKRAVILRLSGEVEVVTWNRRRPQDILHR